MQVGSDDRVKAREKEIAAREQGIIRERTNSSAKLFERAVRTLPMGVASTFQAADPYPVYLDRGSGSRVWDVDANEYFDFHNGFGVNVVGHAHPKIVEAIAEAASSGTHFAVSTETTVALAEAICERFGLEQLRFVNSGTEATMDAIRVARAATGRDIVLKIEGSYHGHHDSVLFSVVPESDILGVRYTTGVEGDIGPERRDGAHARHDDATYAVGAAHRTSFPVRTVAARYTSPGSPRSAMALAVASTS